MSPPSRQVPRLCIAGVSSGVGKTTLTVGLCRALRARGLDVRLFKCGPDYLDPTYHRRAHGTQEAHISHNLDGWLMGRDAVTDTFVRATEGADLALVEGVMGLHDGTNPSDSEGSTAELARWLAAPVLLVADASGMARSFAALVAGFQHFDAGVDFAGVIANRVGSRSHLDLLRRALNAAGLSPLLGGLPAEPRHQFPGRHLGLTTATHEAVPEALFDAWAALCSEWLPLDEILTRARAAPPLPDPAAAPGPPRRRPCRIAVAEDEAFHFYYADNLRRLEAAGATLVRFSPLRDAALPAGCGGLYLGGGYPELFAERLSANRSLNDDIRALARSGRPIYGECGGLMYLCEAITTRDGASHPMLGLLPGRAVMSDRLEALGYVEVELERDGILGPRGLRLRGHQFRYSRLEGGAPGSYRVRKRRGGDSFIEGHAAGNVLGSYVHVHWASNPLGAEAFVAACADGQERNQA